MGLPRRTTQAYSASLAVRLLHRCLSCSGRSGRRIICFLLAVVVLRLLSTPTPFRTRFLQLLHRPGSDGTFAQNYQDNWLVAFAEKQNWVGAGFFLDVGAFNGIWCSNTRLLEDAPLRWRGACVEPFPKDFEDRRCQLVVRAMSDTDGEVVRFGGEGQTRHLQGGEQKERGTDVGGARGQGQGQGKKPAAAAVGVTEPELPPWRGLSATTISFPELLRVTGAPTFINAISLDIEGNELRALRRFPFADYKVGAWIVEKADQEEDGHSPTNSSARLLEANGYVRAEVENAGVDSYFVHSDFKSEYPRKKMYRSHPLGSFGC